MPLPERQLIARLRRRFRSAGRSVKLGIGDDCAILQIAAGEEALVTTDFSLEGVHFRRDWQSAACIGHRCLARGLSDIAAMGGRPVAAFLSLAVPSKLSQSWVDGFFAGLLRLVRRYKFELAGGDTAQSLTGVLADIVIVGAVKRGTALRRSGSKVGDQIYVTGKLGESAATLELLRARKVERRDIFPEPRIVIGEWLRKNRIATAAIDVSDGLSTDLAHVCEESGVGAVIEAEAIPIHPAAQHFKSERALELALHGGEDYELLFTAPRSIDVPRRIAGVKVTRIGEIVPARNKIHIVQDGRKAVLFPRGWEHFRSSPGRV